MKKINKKNQKKERNEWFYITPKNGANPQELAITYHPEIDKFSVEGKDDFIIKHVVSHERDSGKDKTISSASITNEFFSGKSFDQHIRESHEYLIAIDTNTDKVEGDLFVSICCSYITDQKIEKGLERYTYSHLYSFVMFHKSKDVKIESFGWHLVLSKFIKEKESIISTNKNIGVVVDSQLGLIHEINERLYPYYGNNILPKGYSLIYSSSDKTDHIGNRIISMCDKGANLLLNHLKEKNKLADILSLNLAILDGVKYVEARGRKEPM